MHSCRHSLWSRCSLQDALGRSQASHQGAGISRSLCRRRGAPRPNPRPRSQVSRSHQGGAGWGAPFCKSQRFSRPRKRCPGRFPAPRLESFHQDPAGGKTLLAPQGKGAPQPFAARPSVLLPGDLAASARRPGVGPTRLPRAGGVSLTAARRHEPGSRKRMSRRRGRTRRRREMIERDEREGRREGGRSLPAVALPAWTGSRGRIQRPRGGGTACRQVLRACQDCRVEAGTKGGRTYWGSLSPSWGAAEADPHATPVTRERLPESLPRLECDPGRRRSRDRKSPSRATGSAGSCALSDRKLGYKTY